MTNPDEIYRELDSTLRSKPQFAAQLRDTGRARQPLPAVAKRMRNESTSTIVSAANERRTRQRTAEHRVDMSGSGGAAATAVAQCPRATSIIRV